MFTSSIVDANSYKTKYGFTALDQLLRRTDPKGLSDVVNQYDNNQKLLQATDRNGHLATYTYDPLNRRKSASYADGSSVQYSWDAGNRLTQIADTAGNTPT